VSLQEYLGPVWDDWSKYEIDSWKRYLAMTANVPCNWKIVLDNFNESYHLPTVHPEADAVVEESYKDTQFDMSAEGHNRMWQQAFKPSKRRLKNGKDLMDPALAMRMEGWGLDPDDFAGREFESREAVQEQMRKLGPDMGYTHFDNLKDHQLTDVYHYTIFPNFAVSVWADSFHFLRARPHPTDPTKCVFDNWYYAPAPEGLDTDVLTINGPVARDAEIEHDVFEYGEKSLSPLIDQDMGVTLGQQLGLRSRAFKGVYLSHQEWRIRRYHEVIDEYIDGVRPGPNQNLK
jgi:phenylpropionate dioxygenase-like ring-hydroxylating dioxygenase large terminal subunit